MSGISAERKNNWNLFVRKECSARSELFVLFQEMISYFPKPAMMPNNGRFRSGENDYELGYHGGYAILGPNVIRIGLREFMEVFAGLRLLQDNGARYVKEARKLPQEQNRVQHFILRNLTEGRLPKSIEIIKTGEDDNDDWVEICFGEIDPAIASFR